MGVLQGSALLWREPHGKALIVNSVYQCDRSRLNVGMKILISGAGIAGPTLAYWLAQYGFEPVIVERSPHLRTGGYVIDFWGAGFDVADRMGLLSEISGKGYMVRAVRVVNRSGKRVAGFPATAFSRATRGRYLSIPRGDLAASIFNTIEGKVETIFGDSVDSIEQTAEGVRVTFERSAARNFDLVVGADGLHSRVREVVFGAQSRFEKYLGYKVAAFAVDGYRPRDELIYVMYTQVGQQVARFAMRGDRTMFLFNLRGPGERPGRRRAGTKNLIARAVSERRVGMSSDSRGARCH